MKPKSNYKADKNGTSYDDCNTPYYAVDPLISYLANLHPCPIWEPATGMGILADCLQSDLPNHIIRTGLPGRNYFDYEPDGDYIQVTNPPFGVKLEWMKTAYERGHPFALLMPNETIGSRKAKDLFQKYGIQILYLYPRVDFIMPHMELYGHGAQFPVAWFTWKLGAPEGFCGCTLNKPSHKEQIEWWEFWKRNHQAEYWQWWKDNAYPLGTKVTWAHMGGVFEIVGHLPGNLYPYEIRRERLTHYAVGWELKLVKEP